MNQIVNCDPKLRHRQLLH